MGFQYAITTVAALLGIGFSSKMIAQAILDNAPHLHLSYLFLFGATCLVLTIAAAAAIWVMFRWDLFYSNVQVYERGEDSIAIDLFLKECGPIHGLSQLVSYQIGFSDIKELVGAIKLMLNAAHSTKSVLAGYYCESSQNKIEFYIYSSQETKLEQLLRKHILALGLKLEDFKYRYDPKWTVYDSLYPIESELDSLSNRFQIEQLYERGLRPDTQYDIKFYVAFKNKNDPINFEDEISHLGFKLTFASYPEMGPLDSDYNFFGEYRIKSYITSRRIDYLCDNIKLSADGFGAKFCMDWLVEP
jgi:hypothetical protein